MNKWILIFVFTLINLGNLQAQKKVIFSNLDVNGGLLYVPNTIDPYSGTGYEEHSNGNKKMEIQIKDGKINGKLKEWEKNGQKIYEAQYENGKQVGTEFQWFATGEIKVEVNYINNLPEGVFMEYHKNGQLKSKGDFVTGEEDGIHEWWYDNGQLDQQVKYVKGKEDGEVNGWYRSGKKRINSHYTNGEKNGKVTEWYENEQVQSESSFKDGVEHGLTFFWSKQGLLLSERLFEHGELIEEKNYKNGNIRINGGFVEVFNTHESFFRVNVLGDKTRSVRGRDVTYIVDGKILTMYFTNTAKFNLEGKGAEAMITSFLEDEISYIKKNIKGDVKVETQLLETKRGYHYAYWHFKTPIDKEEKETPRTVKEEHYISLLCNKQILSLYGMVTNSDSTEDVVKMLKATAESLVVEEERIDLNALSKKLNLGK